MEPLSSLSGRSLADPVGSSSFATAAQWVEHLLVGTVATAVATIAVAAIGYLVLTGRVDLRRGATVVIGCFILFGAPRIAAGLLQLSSNGELPARRSDLPPTDPPPIISPPLPAPSDPYAGA